MHVQGSSDYVIQGSRFQIIDIILRNLDVWNIEYFGIKRGLDYPYITLLKKLTAVLTFPIVASNAFYLVLAND